MNVIKKTLIYPVMKRFILLVCSVLLFVCLANGQTQDVKYWGEPFNMKAVMNAKYKKLAAGTPILIKGVVTLPQKDHKAMILALLDSTEISIPLKYANRINTQPQTATEFWQSVALKCGMYSYFDKKGYRNAERKALNDESRSYLARLKDLEYEDDIVTNFVKSNFETAYSVNIDPNRLDRIAVRLIASPEPDAFLLPNGTLVLSTGLLCTLDSEDELVAIITNEMCHYLLDHPLNNVVSAENRSRHSAFWSAVLMEVANVAANISCESCGDHDNVSKVSAGVALASGIGSIVSLANVKEVNRLGMNYSLEQDVLADSVTTRFLQMEGMNTNALPSALYKIKNFYLSQGKLKDISRYVSCKSLEKRMSHLGGCDSILVSPVYLKTMAGVVTANARMYYGDKRYDYAEKLIEKNVKYDLADSQDYVLLAQSKMKRFNTAEVNEECLKLLDKAQQVATTTNMDIFRPRIELLQRLGKQDDMKSAIQQYQDALENYNNQVNSNQHEKDWIKGEQTWLNSLKDKQ